jgi:hypothetical protein
MAHFRAAQEVEAAKRVQELFTTSKDTLQERLDSFPKYVRRPVLTRFLALYEIFKRILPVKGSIVECGVFRGFGLMSWAKLSAILEPTNLTRRIYGFDSFEGFPSPHTKDKNSMIPARKGHLSSNSFDELNSLIGLFDQDRYLGHIPKVKLIKGDARKTVPKFVKDNRQLVISLLFLDFDLYEPTRLALKHFIPRMPRGSVVAFDELDNPIWPGETEALLEEGGIHKYRIERLQFDPYIGFAVIE